MENYAELSCLEYQTNSAESFYSHGILGFISRRRVNRIIGKLSGLGGRVVLDAGCEAGFISLKLSDASFRVVAFDVCKDAVADFRRKINSKPNPLVSAPFVADVYALPLKDSSFNAVVCSEVIPFIPSLKEMFAEFERVLKNDGLLVLSFGDQKNRRRLFPLLKLAGMNTDAVDKTFPHEHRLEDVISNTGDNFTVKEIDLFPFKYFTLNTIVVLRKTKVA